jgi:hypothetical protein
MLGSVASLNAATVPDFDSKDIVINHTVFIGESFNLSSDEYESLKFVKGANKFVDNHFIKTVIFKGVILRATKLGHFEGKAIIPKWIIPDIWDTKTVSVNLDIVAPAPKPPVNNVLTPQPLSKSIIQKK